MSLLYECINGIIQGGILESTDGVREGEEIASLCVGKLRSMIEVEDDPNCESEHPFESPLTLTTNVVRYVALLAFNRIVTSHPNFVAMHQDAILSCIDDPDISIRLQALDLGASMVNSDNLMTVVERLIRQLRKAPLSISAPEGDRRHSEGIEPAADSDGEDPAATLRPVKGSMNDVPPLPAEYRVSIIRRILDMCSKDVYANISDFEWYIETLTQLVKLVPPRTQSSGNAQSGPEPNSGYTSSSAFEDISESIGSEIRNVAIRVSTVRAEAVNAAARLMLIDGGKTTFANFSDGGEGVLRFSVWAVGEYSDSILDAPGTLTSAIHPKIQSLASLTICAYLQAIPKILTRITSSDSKPWTPERKSMVSLLLARITHFLEPLTTHPNLEVQERCVELLELIRVASQAVTDHDHNSEHGPLLLTRAIPSLYTGEELKPVAPTAQKKVPFPEELDFDAPINENLAILLSQADYEDRSNDDSAEFNSFYNVRPSRKPVASAAIGTLPSIDPEPLSYQQTDGSTLDPEVQSKKRQERRLRNRDDPFYIAGDDNVSGASTPFHDILRSTNGEDVDVDSIPIMDLDLGDKLPGTESSDPEPRKQKQKQPKKHHIAMDENLDFEDSPSDHAVDARSYSPAPAKMGKAKKSLLEVDSSGLGTFSLDNDEGSQLDNERCEIEDADMARALAEVERLRMEMQRASERVQVEGMPPEGEPVKKKKKKKRKDVLGRQEGEDEDADARGEEAVVKKKKKKKKAVNVTRSEDQAGDG